MMQHSEYDLSYLWAIALASLKYCRDKGINLTAEQPETMQRCLSPEPSTTSAAYDEAIEVIDYELDYNQ